MIQVQLRRDTSANWSTNNPVLALGEIGLVTTTPKKMKIGDGATSWNSLDYISVDDSIAQSSVLIADSKAVSAGAYAGGAHGDAEGAATSASVADSKAVIADSKAVSVSVIASNNLVTGDSKALSLSVIGSNNLVTGDSKAVSLSVIASTNLAADISRATSVSVIASNNLVTSDSKAVSLSVIVSSNLVTSDSKAVSLSVLASAADSKGASAAVLMYTPRVTTITTSATPTINTDSCDVVTITGLAAAITSFTTNLSGTPVNFQKLVIRIKDDGTARAITWGNKFIAKGVALPTTTVISKLLSVGFIYNTVTALWECVASAQEV